MNTFFFVELSRCRYLERRIIIEQASVLFMKRSTLLKTRSFTSTRCSIREFLIERDVHKARCLSVRYQHPLNTPAIADQKIITIIKLYLVNHLKR
jgi:hypothetical protein